VTVLLILQTLVLGIVEGLTEFLPVSSTGHLIVAGDLIGFNGSSAEVFDVVIQLGAILAICVLYFQRLFKVLIGLHSDPAARRFAIAVIVAFLPAAVIGLALHDFIKNVLFSPYVVCASLVVGGIAILVIERFEPKTRFHEVEDFRTATALKIGFFQCLAMVPGVSRSGATILGAVLIGVDRKTAAEFSFFLAIPTMLGASTLDLWKARHMITADDTGIIAIGFVAAAVSALFVVRWLVNYVSHHDFSAFGWYRIVFGSLLAIYFLNVGG
jgi:undecaprenyl-diphosphatase